MTARFIVRAQVVNAGDRKEFDRWYREEHLPDALKAFKAGRAWRGWSDLDKSVHYAVYEFDDLASARAIEGSPALTQLVAEFDRVWGDRVIRSRDFVDAIQAVDA